DRELGQEEMAQTMTRVVERGRHMGNVGGADEPDQPVAKVLALNENEDDENDDQDCRRERPEQRTDKRNQRLKRAARWLVHLNRDQAVVWSGPRRRGFLLAGPRLGLLDLFVELSEHGLRTFQRCAAAAAQALDLLADGRLIFRQVLGKRGDLGRENAAQFEDRRERDQDYDNDRG